MKKPVLLAMATAAICFSVAREAQAQVAIIDLKYVFDNHMRFKQMTEEMRRSVQAAETDINARKDRINSLIKQLEGVKKGTPDYKQLEDEITQQKADLNALVSNTKREFMRREAKIYYIVYQEIVQEVEYFAQQNRLTLVLRFNGDPIDENDPDLVAKHLNKQVVWHHRNIDITGLILDTLNKRQGGIPAAQGGVNQPTTQPRTGQTPSVPFRPGTR